MKIGRRRSEPWVYFVLGAVTWFSLWSAYGCVVASWARVKRASLRCSWRWCGSASARLLGWSLRCF